MTQFELNENEQLLVSNILGDLNFSSGSYDAQFAKSWNTLFESLATKGSETLWSDSISILKSELSRLEQIGGAFSDSIQAKSALRVLNDTLTEYRVF
ncbi:MAG: hypothetical protein J6X44_12145, partial [Thermoguttaceae bacterium]|nr:hypothetical protein [Thermoguttaceae bacterium]